MSGTDQPPAYTAGQPSQPQPAPAWQTPPGPPVQYPAPEQPIAYPPPQQPVIVVQAPPAPAPVQQQQQQNVTIVNNQSDVVVVDSYSRYITLACFVAWCCNPLFGLIAFILAMVASTMAVSDPNAARNISRASLGMSIAGMVVSILVIIIAVAVANSSSSSSGSSSYSSSSYSSSSCNYYYSGSCYRFKSYTSYSACRSYSGVFTGSRYSSSSYGNCYYD